MSFQAYLDSVKAKTGKTVADFRTLAEHQGLTRHGEIVAWLKEDFALGHGHATAVAGSILRPDHFDTPTDRIGALFTGRKAAWRPVHDALMARVEQFGEDVGAAPTDSYVRLLRGGKKFAVVQPAGERLDLGIKLRGAAPDGPFEAAGSWNTMVTYRVRVQDPQQLDAEVIDGLRRAYLAT